jgi:hypothetical protein
MHKRQTSQSPAGLETVIHASEWSQTDALGYVLRGSDKRARASMRVQAIGVIVSYVTATGWLHNGVIESA